MAKKALGHSELAERGLRPVPPGHAFLHRHRRQQLCFKVSELNRVRYQGMLLTERYRTSREIEHERRLYENAIPSFLEPFISSSSEA